MAIDLNRVKSMTWVMLLFLITAIISSGTLFIFSFYRNIFLESDLIKLILLATSITIPIWLINTALYLLIATPKHYISWGDNHDETENLQISSMVGCVISIPLIYLPIIINFFLKINAHIGIGIILILEFLLVIVYIFESRKKIKK